MSAFPTISEWRANRGQVNRFLMRPPLPCHFRTVSLLTEIAKSGEPRAAAETLCAIAEDNIKRAGLLLVDMSKPKSDWPFFINSAPNIQEELESLSPETFKVLNADIEQLPTVDAAHYSLGREFNKTLKRKYRFLAKNYAAWRLLVNMTPPQYRHSFEKEVGELSPEFRKEMDRFSSGFLPPQYDPESCDETLKRFYEWAKVTFPSENYGYQAVAERILHGSENETISGRLRTTYPHMLPPRAEHWDGEPDQAHQCFNTAIAARGYFSQLGISTDVYMANLRAEMQHVIAVAYMPSGGRLVPHIIDASPFAGTYKISDFTEFAPLDLREISKLDEYRYDLIRQSIAWFCKGLPGGRLLLGFASVKDGPGFDLFNRGPYKPEDFERGGAAYYRLYHGVGPRHRAPEISLYLLLPSENSWIEFEGEENGETKMPDQFEADHGSREIVNAAIKSGFADLSKTLERLGCFYRGVDEDRRQ